MTRPAERARRERDPLLVLERRIAHQAESKAVEDGVVETVALSEARGSAFDHRPPVRGRRATPYRRQTGLQWLTSKGRLSPSQLLAGQRYGACYRRALSEGAIPSTLDIKPRTSAPGGPTLAAVLNRAEGAAQAQARLTRYRRLLHGQEALVRAVDLICGEERTPREAAAEDREAGKLEAVLLVALDILASAPVD